MKAFSFWELLLVIFLVEFGTGAAVALNNTWYLILSFLLVYLMWLSKKEIKGGN